MAGRIRSIKPELLDDEKVAGLSDRAFRLFIGAIVLSDDYGNLRAAPEYLRSSIWWGRKKVTPKDVSESLDECYEAGLLESYRASGQKYAHVRSWTKHQRVNNAGKARMPGPEQADSGTYAPFRGDSPQVAADGGGSPLDHRPPITDHRPPTTAGGGVGGVREVPAGAAAAGAEPGPASAPSAAAPVSQPPPASSNPPPAARAPAKPTSPEAAARKRARALVDVVGRAGLMNDGRAAGYVADLAIAVAPQLTPPRDPVAVVESICQYFEAIHESYAVGKQPPWTREGIERHAGRIQSILDGREPAPPKWAPPGQAQAPIAAITGPTPPRPGKPPPLPAVIPPTAAELEELKRQVAEQRRREAAGG